MNQKESIVLYNAVLNCFGTLHDYEEDVSVQAMTETLSQCHYEKWNGQGWPSALSGEAIPLASRIVSIAKAFVVLESLNPDGIDWTTKDVINTLHEGAGVYFDPGLVALFEPISNEILMEQFANREVEYS